MIWLHGTFSFPSCTHTDTHARTHLAARSFLFNICHFSAFAPCSFFCSLSQMLPFFICIYYLIRFGCYCCSVALLCAFKVTLVFSLLSSIASSYLISFIHTNRLSSGKIKIKTKQCNAMSASATDKMLVNYITYVCWCARTYDDHLDACCVCKHICLCL